MNRFTLQEDEYYDKSGKKISISGYDYQNKLSDEEKKNITVKSSNPPVQSSPKSSQPVNNRNTISSGPRKPVSDNSIKNIDPVKDPTGRGSVKTYEPQPQVQPQAQPTQDIGLGAANVGGAIADKIANTILPEPKK